MFIMTTTFDTCSLFDEYIKIEDWRLCAGHLQYILSHVAPATGSPIALVVDDLDAIAQGISEADDPAVSGTPIKVVDSLNNYLARLNDEYNKALQLVGSHTIEYAERRILDEDTLIGMLEATIAYNKSQGDNASAADVAMMLLQLIYYKHDSKAASLKRDIHVIRGGNPATAPTLYNTEAKVEDLSTFIFAHGDDKSRIRALLCAVQHHAIHDRYYRARDMLLISHVQDTIESAEERTQILFNRALVNLGLCAFRVGMIQKAYDSLNQICSGRLRELLAQGHSRWHGDRSPEQEKAEKRLQLPKHMHVNPELLEGCHLISAMFLELPHIARSPGIQHVISRHFRKYYNNYARQAFIGPPENTREHILAAAKALINGDWKRARDQVVNLEIWDELPGEGASKVREMLAKLVREEGIRIYLLTYGQYFESLSLEHISDMFDLTDPKIARRIISQMIFNKEISAAWEYPADTLVLYKVGTSTIQNLSQALVEKVNNLMESNERLMDPFINNIYGHRDDNRGKYYDRDDRNNQGEILWI